MESGPFGRNDPDMAEAPKRGMTVPILIAAFLTLIVVVVRLVGELNGWDPQFFSPAAGGGGALVGITWLVPVFGFWFGRRLAKNGHRPRSIAGTIGACVLGFALVAGLFYVAFATEMVAGKEDWGRKAMIAFPGAAVAGLVLAIAWGRAWLTLAIYGILARIPVLAIQYLAFEKDWKTHFNAVGKDGPKDPETLNRVLLYAEGLFWPFGFTVLVGGLFAALGAATVRKG